MKLLRAEVFCSAQPQSIKDWRVKPCPGVRGAHNSSARGRGRATNRAECGDKCRAALALAVTKVSAVLSLFLLTSHSLSSSILRPQLSQGQYLLTFSIVSYTVCTIFFIFGNYLCSYVCSYSKLNKYSYR